MKVVICETRIKPRLIQKESSRGDGTIYITIPSTIWNDPVCDCKGFQFRGYCRHTEEVEANACRFVEPYPGPIDTECPLCQNPLVVFEIEPEFDA